MAKLTKKFKSVNYIRTCGDNYARWAATNDANDAVSLTVTDENKNEVFFTIVRKNNIALPTLACCREACLANYRMFQESVKVKNV